MSIFNDMTKQKPQKDDAGFNNAFDVYTEQDDSELNKNQNKKEDEIVDYMKNIAEGKLEKFKNLKNLFGGLFDKIDLNSILDPEKFGQMLKDWIMDKLQALGDKFKDALMDLKDQLIELGKDKLKNLIETSIDSIVLPDEIFLAGLSGTYYVGGADLNANNGYIRRVCIDHDYPKSLEWCNGEFGYVYNYKIDRSLCVNDMNSAITKGCHKVAFMIIEKIYKDEYLMYRKDLKSKRISYETSKDPNLLDEITTIEGDVKNIEYFIVESFKDMIVYSYSTLLPPILSGYINKIVDPDTNRPIFLPKYLGETDDVYDGKFFITESDLDTMVPFVHSELFESVEDLIDSRKVTFKNKIRKAIRKSLNDDLANVIADNLTEATIVQFEPHNESSHKKLRDNYKTDPQEITFRNSMIKLIYVYLSNSDIWGNDVMVHCGFYGRLMYTPRSVLTETAGIIGNSQLGSILKDMVNKGEMSGIEYVQSVYDILFNPATFMNFGDVSGLINTFYRGFPAVRGSDNSVFNKESEIMDTVNSSLSSYISENGFSDDYIDENMYIVPNTFNPGLMIQQASEQFSKIVSIYTTIISATDNRSYYYQIKILMNKIIRFIHVNYFNSLTASSPQGNNPDEMYFLAKTFFTDDDYTNWESQFNYLNFDTFYGLYMFYCLANTFYETNTKDVTFPTGVTPINTTMTMRRLFRIVDSLLITCSYFSKEYSINQDNTISVFMKDYLEIFDVITDKEAVTVPINTSKICSGWVESIYDSIPLFIDSDKSIDAQMRLASVDTKYSQLRESNYNLSKLLFYYLTETEFDGGVPILDSTGDNKDYLNNRGFDELYDGFMSMYDIVWSCFTANLYDVNNMDKVESENVNIDDKFLINSVINSIPEYVDKNGYLTHINYRDMRYRIKMEKFT